MTSTRLGRRRLLAILAALSLLALVAGAARPWREAGDRDRGEGSLREVAQAHHRNTRAQAVAVLRERLDGKEGSGEVAGGPAQEAYEDRAWPRSTIDAARATGAQAAFDRLPAAAGGGPRSAASAQAAAAHSWQELGPTNPVVPGAVTYTGTATTTSGRVTALAVDPNCKVARCRVWVGAAGGGVWRTDHGLASSPAWVSSSNGLASNAIGSLAVDPTDRSGNTLYAGTGEPNASSDSEAGVGLYRSVDGGVTWRLVPGSVAVARSRAIAAIAVDPANRRHLYIGTAVARHGSTSVNGGALTPPGAPALGLYQSSNGGTSFTLAFQEGPSGDPAPGGSDSYQGGVTGITFDRSHHAVYVVLFGYGIWRQSQDLDGDAAFHQVFATREPDSAIGDRTAFALTSKSGHTRIYAADAGDSVSELWRTDDADVPAASLTDGQDNPGWQQLSSATNGTPGFASYGFCESQCWYDMFVATPAGRPDTVWIGGSMNYTELWSTPRSNGRAVMRSTDAGAHFTDMTDDAQARPVGMHPDQHAIAFSPGDPNVAFVGSDGGVVRTGGQFVDRSADCADRGLSSTDLADCQAWLAAVPNRIVSLNRGLRTLQFQSVSTNPHNVNDLLGGTQDNGTWSFTGASASWSESIGGDGGQSGIDASNGSIRYHTYYGPQADVDFHGTSPTGWDWIMDPVWNSGEEASFYVPMIADPTVAGVAFVGAQHLWRTTDHGGNQAQLDQHCNEYTGDFAVTCGDWVPLGQDLTGTAFGSDRAGQYVVAVERAPSNSGVLWAATRTGRVLITHNAMASSGDVAFDRIDVPSGGGAGTPGRFVSGIAVDPANANHAFVSFSGYDAYTPDDLHGHVFEVTFDPGTSTATWVNRSYDLGDQPVTDVQYDRAKGRLLVATDFGVLALGSDHHWRRAAAGLPLVAVYGLTLDQRTHTLYAATHGRGVWRLTVS